LKYKALILKYVPYLFYKMPYLFLHDGKHSFFSPLFLHFLHENLNLNTKLSLAQLFVLPFMLSLQNNKNIYNKKQTHEKL